MTLTARFLAAASVAASLTACTHNPVPEGRPGHSPRYLTQGEIAMAQKIFGNQIDYRRVTVSSHNLQRSKAPNGHLLMSAHQYSDDYATETNPVKRRVFMHEMTHVWQTNRGISVADAAIDLFFKNGGDYDRAYDYNIHTTVDFDRLSIEQQGNVVMDYFDSVEALTAATRGYRCPEIKEYESVLKPYFPAIQTPRLCR